MCTQAAKLLSLQCVREYGFEETVEIEELFNYTCYQLKKSNNCQPINIDNEESVLITYLT